MRVVISINQLMRAATNINMLNDGVTYDTRWATMAERLCVVSLKDYEGNINIMPQATE